MIDKSANRDNRRMHGRGSDFAFFAHKLCAALDASARAGELIRTLFGKVFVTSKAPNNFVTEADTKSQRLIVSALARQFPGDSFYGEEEGLTERLDADRLWIIDPLDGTNNYAHGIPHCCVSIAYAEKGIVRAGVIYDPFRHESFSAIQGGGATCNSKSMHVSSCQALEKADIVTGIGYERGAIIRKTLDVLKNLLDKGAMGFHKTGSAALDLCWVACGRFDAFYEYALSPWDFAAGMLIVREAGGECLDREGTRLTLDKRSIVASNKALLKILMPLVRYRPSKAARS